MIKRIYNYFVVVAARSSTILLYKWRMRQCGAKTVIQRPLYFTPKNVSMGNGVYIWKNARIEAVINYEGQTYQPEIIFEDGVSIQQNLHLTCAEKIVVGRNTAIAANVTITDIHHSYDDIYIPIERQRLKTAPVKIGEDCKIYNNAVILQGITIGKHVTVAANSVVTKSIPDFCVVAGIPAMIIKRYNFEKGIWVKSPPPPPSVFWRKFRGGLRRLFYLPNQIYYSLILKKYSFRSIIKSPLRIDGGKNISIGERVIVQYKTWLAALPLTEMEYCRLIINDGVVIGHFNHIYATKSIIIEEDALLADRVYITDNLHDYSNPTIPIKLQKIIQKNEVVIGSGCWIGENVSIIGASVGKNSVIGSNSVVTKNIPDFCVAVGIPARIIKRYNFEQKQWEKTDASGDYLK